MLATPTTAELLASANERLAAHAHLVSRVRAAQREHRRILRSLPSPPSELLSLPLIPSPRASPPPSPPESPEITPIERLPRSDLPPAKRARAERYVNYVPEEETIRNDYSQRYVDGGEWPQDWVIGAEPERRFEEYPKQQRLLALKKTAVADNSLPATYLSMAQLPNLTPLKFDVILIDPPFSSSFSWEQLERLPVPSLAADPSFVFLWVGSGAGEGLERGREILGKWGYRRCEDVCWVKTNNESNKGPGTDPPTTSLLTRTKQHCLMGIRGTVRRSTDSWFVHCNIDTDVIIWEGDPTNPTRKPPEMYQLIENFCLGMRRLELFGRYHSLRRGWITVTAEELQLTPEESREKDNAIQFDKDLWESQIKELAKGGKYVVPNTQEIEALRPKSPGPRGGMNTMSNHLAPIGASAGLPNNPLSQSQNSSNSKATSSSANNTYTPQITAQPMRTSNGGRGVMRGSDGIGPVGAMGPNAIGGMGPMNAMNSMGNINPMGNAMGGMNFPGMGGMNPMGPVGMQNMQNMHVPAMGAPISLGGGAGPGTGGPGFGFGFDGGPGVGVPMMGMGNMGQLGGMNMPVGGMGGMGTGGMGTLGMPFDPSAMSADSINFAAGNMQQGGWMGPGGPFMQPGMNQGMGQMNQGMWDGSEAEMMNMGMGGGWGGY